MRGIAAWVDSQRITHDKFQSFVCWMLFLGALLALIPPTLMIVFDDDDVGCLGSGYKKFTVFAHYSTHQWLTEQFNAFKEAKAGPAGDFEDMCYELIMADSVLDIEAQPTMWMPENQYWINDAQNKSGVLIGDADSDCINTTDVPFGIITWKKYANLLTPNNRPIPFGKLVELALYGWRNVTNGEIKNYYPDADELTLASGHPNVTSGGILGLLTGFSVLSGGTDPGSVFEFLSGPPVCKPPSTQKWNDEVIPSMEVLQSKILSTAAIDYSITQMMMSRGPEFLQMAFGFENDVALINENQGEQINFLWNDSIHFIYLKESYWITHPLCKLTAAEWYNDVVGEVADSFMDWIGTHVEELQKTGLRPYNDTLNNDSIITAENGCNPEVNNRNDQFIYPRISTAECMLREYQEVKKPVHLHILLDVTKNMQTTVGGSVTRWSFVGEALSIFAQRLEDDAKIELICFGNDDVPLPCSSSTDTAKQYPANTELGESREHIETFLLDLSPRNSQTEVSLFRTLNYTYNQVLENKNDTYHSVILVVSEEDTVSGEEEAESLLLNIGLSFDPQLIRIYPILFFGTEDSLSHNTLQEIAARTTGEFTTAKASLKEKLVRFAYFF